MASPPKTSTLIGSTTLPQALAKPKTRHRVNPVFDRSYAVLSQQGGLAGLQARQMHFISAAVRLFLSAAASCAAELQDLTPDLRSR